MINQENYISFIIDYFDKNLTDSEVRELMQFLDKNPGCKAEFDQYDPVYLKVEDGLSFPDKNSLKMPAIKETMGIHANNFEKKFLEAAPFGKTKAISTFLVNNPFLERDWQLSQLTVLKTDEEIIYPEKDKLKKNAGPLTMPWVQVSAIAASLLLLISLGINLLQLPEMKHEQLQTLNQKMPELELNPIQSKLAPATQKPTQTLARTKAQAKQKAVVEVESINRTGGMEKLSKTSLVSTSGLLNTSNKAKILIKPTATKSLPPQANQSLFARVVHNSSRKISSKFKQEAEARVAENDDIWIAAAERLKIRKPEQEKSADGPGNESIENISGFGAADDIKTLLPE